MDNALGIKITYSATGSGAGIAQITARTVDFGASDAPLSPDQLTACKGCVVIPWALAGMSIPYNLPGVGKRLVLNGAVLANIYLGNITTWNAAAIRALNPGVNLPDTKITVVYRSDGSGSTYAFTNYLATVSPQFKSKVGVNTSVNFPTGTGARGNEEESHLRRQGARQNIKRREPTVRRGASFHGPEELQLVAVDPLAQPGDLDARDLAGGHVDVQQGPAGSGTSSAPPPRAR